ncbi:MAG: hypothetical protein Fur0035_01680 [Anaerolineales bacterium]
MQKSRPVFGGNLEGDNLDEHGKREGEEKRKRREEKRREEKEEERREEGDDDENSPLPAGRVPARVEGLG